MPGRMLADFTIEDYEYAAQAYCAALPLEHFMEAIPTGKQREITLTSLAFLKTHRPEVQVMNETLVQYPINAHLGQVVPDNMIVLSEEELTGGGSYKLPFEPAPPFMMLEYVSTGNKRKDYEDNHHKYEQELKVPYYLLFYPEKQDLRLYCHNGVAYDLVEPNQAGRLEVPELELEVALLNGWLRYWYQGKLIPLTRDLQNQINGLQEQVDELLKRTQAAERRAQRQLRRADEASQRADEASQRADEASQRAEQEKQRAEAAEAELAKLRELLEQSQGKKPSRRPKGKQ